MPQVSVIIPTYQSVKYVRSAIESVLSQTFKDFEIIIVDGGSTDGTKEILKSFGTKISILSQKGKGISNARNAGVVAAKGEYIAFLDSDDLWTPLKLEKQLEFIKNNLNTGLVYSDATVFFEENNSSHFIGTLFSGRRPHRGKVAKALIVENFIPCSTVLIRKACFEKIGFFDESLPLCEDHDLWLRVANDFFIDYQSDVLVNFRSRPNSLSTNLECLLITQIELRKRTIRRMPYILDDLDSTFLVLLIGPLLNLGLFYLSTGKLVKARKIFRKYLDWYLFNLRIYLFLLLTYVPFGSMVATGFDCFKKLRVFF
jgi:glycosyltransferase involved in cell wall biosynthesis